MGGLACRLSDFHLRLIQRESFAEIPDQVAVQIHGPMSAVVIGVEPYLAAIRSPGPFLQVAAEPTAADQRKKWYNCLWK